MDDAQKGEMFELHESREGGIGLKGDTGLVCTKNRKGRHSLNLQESKKGRYKQTRGFAFKCV